MKHIFLILLNLYFYSLFCFDAQDSLSPALCDEIQCLGNPKFSYFCKKNRSKFSEQQLKEIFSRMTPDQKTNLIQSTVCEYSTSLLESIDFTNQIDSVFLEEIVNAGASLEKEGSTLLRNAIEKYKKKGYFVTLHTIEFLLEQGVDPNIKDWYGKTLLRKAIESEKFEVATLLWKYQATLVPVSIFMQETNESTKETPLHYLAKYVAANPNNKEAWLLYQEMLKIGKDNKNHEGLTPEEVYANTSGIFQAYVKNKPLRQLVEAGADINQQNMSGQNLAHLRASERYGCPISLDDLKFLINQGIDLTRKDNKGNTPLHIAFKKGNDWIAEFLLKKSRPEVIQTLCSIKNAAGETPLTCAAHYIIKKRSGSKVTDKFFSCYQTVLATSPGNFSDKEIELHLSALGLSHSSYGYNPFRKNLSYLFSNPTISEKAFYALWNRMTPEQKKEFAQKEIKTTVSSKHYTQLSALRFERSIDKVLIKELIAWGANINEIDLHNETLLHKAIRQQDENTVQFLIKHNADFNLKNRYGQTPFHLAIESGNLKIAQLLWEQMKWGLIHKAQLLPDNEGHTPVHYAARYVAQHPKDQQFNNFYQILLSRDDSTQNHMCQTPEQLRLNTLNESFLDKTTQDIDYLKTLLKAGAHINSEDQRGNTKLHLLAQQSNTIDKYASYELKTAVTFLLENGADVNRQNIWRQTPLHVAIQSNNLSVISVLLKHENIKFLPDAHGNTPAHYAAERWATNKTPQLFEIYQELVLHNEFSKNNAGQTPIDLRNSLDDTNLASPAWENFENLGILEEDKYIYLTEESFYTAWNSLTLYQQYFIAQKTPFRRPLLLSQLRQFKHSNKNYLVYKTIIEELIKAGAPVNEVINGTTLLHEEAGVYNNQDKKFIELLAYHNADFNIRDSHGHTALHLAIFNKNFELAYLIWDQREQDVRKVLLLPDGKGYTPVHYLAEHLAYPAYRDQQLLDFYQELLDAGGKIRNHKGQTPEELRLDIESIIYKPKVTIEPPDFI